MELLKVIGWGVHQRRRTPFKVTPPKATFYLWMDVPAGQSSAAFASHLLDKCEIVATPGTAFGDAGEGFIRFALTATKERLLEAAERIQKI